VTNHKPSKIIIHCSATKNGEDIGAAEIRKWHLARGFKDIGYHIIIRVTGEVELGRPLNVVGAHCEGANEGSIGICLIGTDQYTQKQFDVLRYQIDSLRQIYGIKVWEIYAHRQFPSAIKQGKTCPGISINRLLAWYAFSEGAILPHLRPGALF
jgi:hypothetical protein